MSPRHDRLLMLSAIFLGFPHILAGQEVNQEGRADEAATTLSVAVSVDPRFRSPRATVRTFLMAMNSTEDDPHRIEEAVACLDLCAGRATVGQSFEHCEAAVNDVVVGPAVQMGHHADATGVVLECRVVEASGHRRPSGMGVEVRRPGRRWPEDGKKRIHDDPS